MTIEELIEEQVGSHIDEMLNETTAEYPVHERKCKSGDSGIFSENAVEGYQAIITPIDIAGERLGTLVYLQAGRHV